MATEGYTVLVRTIYISIHTTLAGGDVSVFCTWTVFVAFQSTPPSRVATGEDEEFLKTMEISIHTTLAGGDYDKSVRKERDKKISIHTTLAGGDCFPRPTF